MSASNPPSCHCVLKSKRLMRQFGYILARKQTSAFTSLLSSFRANSAKWEYLVTELSRKKNNLIISAIKMINHE